MKQKQLRVANNGCWWKKERDCGWFNGSGQHFHLRVNVSEGVFLWKVFFFHSFLGDSFENSLARKPWALAYLLNKYSYKKQLENLLLCKYDKQLSFYCLHPPWNSSKYFKSKDWKRQRLKHIYVIFCKFAKVVLFRVKYIFRLSTNMQYWRRGKGCAE